MLIGTPPAEADPAPSVLASAAPLVASSAVPVTPTATPSPTTAAAFLTDHPVSITGQGFWSWALLDTATGRITGSATMTKQNDTASMIKSWLGADYLRRATERKQKPSTDQLHEVSIMIRDSDNDAAEDIYDANGRAASIKRLISTCKLTDSAAGPGWSKTMLSARDTARMGECIRTGRAAGPVWTTWLLNEMRQVRGVGRFGIIQALPAAEAKKTAIKNGWLLRDDGLFRINCLAIGDGWVLSVLNRYPGRLGMDHGISICTSVAKQLIGK
jgi:hypothetical protein